MYKKNKVPLGKMKKGLKEGIWKDWYENGVLKSEINYNNGKIEGSHKTYNMDGLLSLYMKVINYEKDNYIKYGLDKNGNLNGHEMYYLNSKGTGTTLKTIDFDRKVKSRNLKKGSQMISTFKDGEVTKVEIFNNNKELLHVFVTTFIFN